MAPLLIFTEITTSITDLFEQIALKEGMIANLYSSEEFEIGSSGLSLKSKMPIIIKIEPITATLKKR